MTNPQEGCTLVDNKIKSPGEQPCEGGQTVNTIHDLRIQGKSVQEIAQHLGISRTTVRKYLKYPEAVIRKPRAQQPSKLDPFHEQIKRWVMEDHCTNCEVLFVRLQKLGYTGGISILKSYVHPLRPEFRVFR